MHVPLRFIFGLVCGLALGLAIFLGLLYTQLGVPDNATAWPWVMHQKKQALAAALPGPRLLLVGGSGTTFGLSAQTIQEQTGYPTLNLGLHAGLGLDYLLYWARQEARPGDTVMLIPEYELYSPSLTNETLADYCLARDTAYFHQLSLFDKISLTESIPVKRFRSGISFRFHPEGKPAPRPPYTDGASYINQFGDQTGNGNAVRPLHSPSMNFKSKNIINGLTSDSTLPFRQLRAFIKWARENHVRVLATFPNITYVPEYDLPPANKSIQLITTFYQSEGVPVIGTAREAMLPTDQFFDTYYHLTHENAIARTERLVPELKPYLNK